MNNINKKIRGFSFIEVMVSVFLISVGLLAAMSLLTVGIRESMDSRNQMIASFLAQEGVELVRSLRDENWVNGLSSFEGTHFSKGDLQGQALDYKLGDCSNQLKINSEGFYEHCSGMDTKFFRKIDISGDDSQKTVSVMVVWNGRSNNTFTEWKDPNINLTYETCNTANKCAYTEDVLTSWAE
jgi:type IV pilus modification protein PilV